jgi:hypothetical protein
VVSPPGGGPIGVRLECFCVGLYALPLFPLILPVASISPAAWRSVRPRYILGTRAAVPFVDKLLWLYALSPKTYITRNSEYLCVVLATCETKVQNGTALSSIALVCNVTCSLCLCPSPSVCCQYGTQRTVLKAALRPPSVASYCTSRVRDPVTSHAPSCGVRPSLVIEKEVLYR